MSFAEYRFDPSQILTPAQPSTLNRTESWKPGSNLAVLRGQAMARKTSDGKCYPLNLAATDGTQVFGGFSHISFNTDASGNVFLTCNGSTGTTYLTPAMTSIDIFTGGVFDPTDLYTGYPTGTGTAEVDTITLGGTIAAGDEFSVASNTANAVVVYKAADATTNNSSGGLVAALSSDPFFASLATFSVTGPIITVTAKSLGYPLNLSVGKNSASGTIVLAQTTAPVAAMTAEVDTFTFTTAPSTGDVFLATVTYPNLTTSTASFTVAATQTVAAAVAGLQAAWNTSTGVSAPSTYATASNTSTAVVLTSLNPGSPMSVAITTTSGSTTIAKVVTTAAFGRNLSDILAGAPGSRILQPTGYWQIP